MLVKLSTPDPHSPPPEVDSLLAQMSLPEKVGQVFMTVFEGPEVSDSLHRLIADCHIGGIILYSITGNLQHPLQIQRLTREIQSLAKIPLLISIDQEGGAVLRLPQQATPFPSAMALGATGSVDLAWQMARGIAEELRALGIRVNFAPVIDVNSNPRNPIIGTRAFGSDLTQVIRLGQAMVEGYREGGVIPTLKHFPGHGDTGVDSHLGLPRIEHGIEHVHQIDLEPFRSLIEQGAEMVMTAHVVVPALGSGDRPATLSSAVLETWLRQHLGFDGVIITDSLTMGALDKTWNGPEAAVLAFQAGADLLLFGADRGHDLSEGRHAYDYLLTQVEAGSISEDRLNLSVTRILKLKARYGLLSRQEPASDLSQVGSVEHHRLADRIAEASITLVKQEADRFPLHRDRSLLLIAPAVGADLAIALDQCHAQVQSYFISLDPHPQEIRQAQILAAERETVVVATCNAWIHPGQVDLIQALPPEKLVVVAIGSPYDLLEFPEVPCYLVSYGHVPASLFALAKVLMGDLPPQGRLPIRLIADPV